MRAVARCIVVCTICAGALGEARGTVAGGRPHGGPTAGTWSHQTSGPSRALNDISCPTANRCYAVGNQSTILSTTNGGGH